MEKVGPIIKRSIVIRGGKTSVSLERDFWEAFKSIAEELRVPVSALAQEIYDTRGSANLSSAIRVYVLRRFRRPMP